MDPKIADQLIQLAALQHQSGQLGNTDGGTSDLSNVFQGQAPANPNNQPAPLPQMDSGLASFMKGALGSYQPSQPTPQASPSQPGQQAPAMAPPQLNFKPGDAYFSQRIPAQGWLGKLLHTSSPGPLQPTTNYLDAYQGFFGKDAPLPSNLPVGPDGRPFLTADQFKQLMSPEGIQAKLLSTQLMANARNPTLSSADQIVNASGGQINKTAAQKMLDDNGGKAVPLSTVRSNLQGQGINVRLQALTNTMSKQDADLASKMADNISAAKKSPTSPFGMQANKVDGATHGMTLLSQVYDPNSGQYNLSPAQYGEFVTNVARTLNNTGVLTNEQMDMVKQPTLFGSLGEFLTKVTGTPFNGSTQDVIKQARDTLIRQGQTSQALRDRYAGQELAGAVGLKQRNIGAYAQVLNMSNENGVNFDDVLKHFPDQGVQSMAGQQGLVQRNPNSPINPGATPQAPAPQTPASKPVDLSGRITMKKPDGSLVGVAAKDVLRAKSMGYQVAQ